VFQLLIFAHCYNYVTEMFLEANVSTTLINVFWIEQNF